MNSIRSVFRSVFCPVLPSVKRFVVPVRSSVRRPVFRSADVDSLRLCVSAVISYPHGGHHPSDRSLSACRSVFRSVLCPVLPSVKRFVVPVRSSVRRPVFRSADVDSLRLCVSAVISYPHGGTTRVTVVCRLAGPSFGRCSAPFSGPVKRSVVPVRFPVLHPSSFPSSPRDASDRLVKVAQLLALDR